MPRDTGRGAMSHEKCSVPALAALKYTEKHFVSGLLKIIIIPLFLFLSSVPFLMPRNVFP